MSIIIICSSILTCSIIYITIDVLVISDAATANVIHWYRASSPRQFSGALRGLVGDNLSDVADLSDVHVIRLQFPMRIGADQHHTSAIGDCDARMGHGRCG